MNSLTFPALPEHYVWRIDHVGAKFGLMIAFDGGYQSSGEYGWGGRPTAADVGGTFYDHKDTRPIGKSTGMRFLKCIVFSKISEPEPTAQNIIDLCPVLMEKLDAILLKQKQGEYRLALVGTYDPPRTPKAEEQSYPPPSPEDTYRNNPVVDAGVIW